MLSSIIFNQTVFIDTMDSLKTDEFFWKRRTPLHCGTIRTIGIFLCIVAFIGFILNGSLFYSFLRYKILRSSQNIFIMFISFIGLLASLTFLPLTGSSSIFCYWLFDRIGCQFEALTAFLYGCSSSYLLCAVSLVRCYIIIKPFKSKSITVKKCTFIAVIVVSIAFIWTLLPIFGWNEYTLEIASTSCCTNWYDQRRSYIAFNISLFIFVYCLPLMILIGSNTIIYIGLRRMRENLQRGLKTDFNQKRIDMEHRILKSILITITGFMITWTPYSICFFLTIFFGPKYSFSPLMTFICACFAKSSVMWIPMLYISTSKQYRLTFVDLGEIEKTIPHSTQQQGNDKNSSIHYRLDENKSFHSPNIISS